MINRRQFLGSGGAWSATGLLGGAGLLSAATPGCRFGQRELALSRRVPTMSLRGGQKDFPRSAAVQK